mmetsp:Transcript_27916/g.37282  ORF Transcript_27916/g.37282 Transcript_27916/m.37282 type:complete len:168 (+) Transcript_27916:12-515(+)
MYQHGTGEYLSKQDLHSVQGLIKGRTNSYNPSNRELKNDSKNIQNNFHNAAMLQKVTLNRNFNNNSARKQDGNLNTFDDRRSTASSVNMMQFGSSKGNKSAGHKNYLQNMLINRMTKRFPDVDEGTRRQIEAEVSLFISSEYVTKESMRQLEQKIARNFNPAFASAQ